MKLKLISFPDCKSHHNFLELEKKYEIRAEVGNAYVVRHWKDPKDLDDGYIDLIILKSRFE